jgi:hypothetical protein
VSLLPYLIVYEVGVDVVTILAVFHTARDLVRRLPIRLPAHAAAPWMVFRDEAP